MITKVRITTDRLIIKPPYAFSLPLFSLRVPPSSTVFFHVNSQKAEEQTRFYFFPLGGALKYS